MVIGFVSFEKEIRELLHLIVKNPPLHGRWINTLSYLENCGARMIAACEHPTLVREEMLKHAAEEFRHALYLKKQLAKIGESYEDYQRSHLLGAWSGYHYLNKLNVQASRYLQSLKLTRSQTKQLAYLLVTYAIELRAGELYPIYQSALKHSQSKVQVQSILLEEKEHLREMEEELNLIPASPVYIETICKLEAILFGKWLKACQADVDEMIYEDKSELFGGF
ncbi:MAG TPA: hypothetical protein VLE95_08140 [Chlamydiales bacterium]|nr:hypothetical protein [Chlamydiales bacterium]